MHMNLTHRHTFISTLARFDWTSSFQRYVALGCCRTRADRADSSVAMSQHAGSTNGPTTSQLLTTIVAPVPSQLSLHTTTSAPLPPSPNPTQRSPRQLSAVQHAAAKPAGINGTGVDASTPHAGGGFDDNGQHGHHPRQAALHDHAKRADFRHSAVVSSLATAAPKASVANGVSRI